MPGRDVAARLRLSGEELEALSRSARHDWVVLSGKMASGKDTVAEGVNAALYGDHARILRYGDLMRHELEVALRAWENALPDQDPAAVIADAIDLPDAYAAEVVEHLRADMERTAGKLTPWERTNGIRWVLQALGGPWRTASDEDYWARSACLSALRAAADGPVLLTGGRFAPDVEIPLLLGAVVIRIDVSEDTQLARLAKRDRLTPDPATLRHPGETVLDGWDGFTARLDGNRDLPDVVAQATRAISSARASRTQDVSTGFSRS